MYFYLAVYNALCIIPTFSNRRRLSMHDNLLDDEPHAREPLAPGRVAPDGLLIDLVHPGKSRNTSDTCIVGTSKFHHLKK